MKISVLCSAVIMLVNNALVTNVLVRRGRAVRITALLIIILYADSHPRNGQGFHPFLDISSRSC